MSKSKTSLGSLALAALLLLGSEAARAQTAPIVVGSADFPESQVLATIYAEALKAKGIATDTKMNIGSREVYMPALIDGSIDLIPEYTGATLNYLDAKSTVSAPDEVAAALKGKLPKGIAMLKPSQAQDSDVITVTKATADKYKLDSIADLKPLASGLVLGGPPEMKARKEGVVGLKNLYGITFKSFKTLDVAGPLTLAALVNGQVQAADMTSTDPAMKESNLVGLKDPKHLYAAQNIVPLIAEKKVNDTIVATLDAVSAALTTDDLVAMNARLNNHDSYDAVAGDWLAAHKLK